MRDLPPWWSLALRRMCRLLSRGSANLNQFHRSLTSDEDYTLFSAVIFRRVHDEFINKCRENKFIVRDFVFSEDSIHTQREELEAADVMEKELWVFHSQVWH
jgi:hypothetical protein